MRAIYCLMALLSGCSTHEVRCDAHLVAINPPRAGAAAFGTADARDPNSTAPPAAIRAAAPRRDP